MNPYLACNLAKAIHRERVEAGIRAAQLQRFTHREVGPSARLASIVGLVLSLMA